MFPCSLTAFPLNYFASIFDSPPPSIQHIPILATGAGKRGGAPHSELATVTCTRSMLSFQLKGTRLCSLSSREANQPHFWVRNN